jgi:ABC-type sugar transport system ATPase subunit
VAENIFLAREPRRGPFIDRARLLADTQRCLDRLGVDIAPRAIVRTLSVAQRQMVEIAKALSIDAEVLIMDEPTSSLTESETELLFKVIRELRSAAWAVYISHRLEEMATSSTDHRAARRAPRRPTTFGDHTDEVVSAWSGARWRQVSGHRVARPGCCCRCGG